MSRHATVHHPGTSLRVTDKSKIVDGRNGLVLLDEISDFKEAEFVRAFEPKSNDVRVILEDKSNDASDERKAFVKSKSAEIDQALGLADEPLPTASGWAAISNPNPNRIPGFPARLQKSNPNPKSKLLK